MRKALLLLLLIGFGSLATAQVTANFSATPLTGCPPMVVSFTNLSTGSITSWSWTFTGGNPSSSPAQNPTTSYLTPGTYTVSLTVSNGSSSNTKTQTNYITVKAPPSPVSFVASPTTACPGVPVSFTSSVTWNSTGTGLYNW